MDFNVAFASEAFSELPPHAYIDKTVCGVGMTSVALECSHDVLLLVPTKLLVNNKVEQYPNNRCPFYLCPVTGDIDDSQIQDYVQRFSSRQPMKVVCTYDSFSRVLPFAQRSNVQIIVDECDKMVSMSSLKVRKDGKIDVMNYMLTELEKMQDRVSFISSTPVPLEYFQGTFGEWLVGLDHYVFNWKNTTITTPIMCKRKQPISAFKKEVVEEIMANGSATIGDRTFRKAIVFMNSVTAICEVIHDCEIDNCSGIICATSNSTTAKLFNYKYDKLRIDDPHNLPMFTFVTSTGFQGIDLYDSEAMNIIITKGTSDLDSSFMLDLQLDVKQAVSRNRDKSNPNSDRFIFYYSQGIFERNYDEIKAKIDETERDVKFHAAELSKIQIKDDGKFLPPIIKKYTYRDNNNQLCLNSLLFNYERYTALEVIKMYQSGFRIMSNMTSTFSLPIIAPKPRTYKNTTYKLIHDKYEAQINGCEVVWTKEELACENYKLVNNCYLKCGRIYKRSNDARKILKNAESCAVIDINAEVKSIIKPGKYTCKELKETLQSVYDSCNYERKAKATDIYDYYPDSAQPVSTTAGGRYIIVK